jgi:hypothetical protein
MAKLAKSRREKTATKAKAAVRKVVERALTLRSKDNNNAASEKSVPASAKPAPDAASSKKISQKFIEAMEKRKTQGGWGARKGSMFGGKPPARRGRRPKASNSEYTPENNSEEAYVLESEYERIEYDTGISCKKPATASEDGFSLDRFDDFDEELNFDR